MMVIDRIGRRTVLTGLALALLIACSVNVLLLFCHLRSSLGLLAFAVFATPSTVAVVIISQDNDPEGFSNGIHSGLSLPVVQVAFRH